MRTHIPTLIPPALALCLLTACSSSDDDDDTKSWVGHTYVLEVPPNAWYEPPNVGGDIGRFVPQFVIQVEGESEGNLDLLIGTANAGVQEMCNPTARVTAASTAPEIQIGPFDFPMYLKHLDVDMAVNATIYDLTITNVLPDGDAVAEEGELAATLDGRDVYSMFTQLGDNVTPESLCTALETFEAPCVACPTDGEAYCLTLKARRLGATEGQAIEPIDAGSVPASCVE